MLVSTTRDGSGADLSTKSATCLKSSSVKPLEVRAGAPMRSPPGIRADVSPALPHPKVSRCPDTCTCTTASQDYILLWHFGSSLCPVCSSCISTYVIPKKLVCLRRDVCYVVAAPCKAANPMRSALAFKPAKLLHSGSKQQLAGGLQQHIDYGYCRRWYRWWLTLSCLNMPTAGGQTIVARHTTVEVHRSHHTHLWVHDTHRTHHMDYCNDRAHRANLWVHNAHHTHHTRCCNDRAHHTCHTHCCICTAHYTQHTHCWAYRAPLVSFEFQLQIKATNCSLRLKSTWDSIFAGGDVSHLQDTIHTIPTVGFIKHPKWLWGCSFTVKLQRESGKVPGTVFLLVAMWAISRTRSTLLPSTPLGLRSSSSRWLSVPPETNLYSKSAKRSAMALLLSSTCSW